MNAATLLRDSMRELSELFRDGCPVALGRPASAELRRMLATVKDFRDPMRITCLLRDLLAICIWMALRGQFTSFLGIGRHASENPGEFVELGFLPRGGPVPSHDTFRRVFCCLDAASLPGEFMPRIEAALRRVLGFSPKWRSQKEIIAVDGKTFNGSGRKGRLRNANVFNVHRISSGVCMSSNPLSDKESEIKEAQSQLRRRKLADAIITADALHCQRKTCRIIVERGGDYLIKAKSNQPELLAEIEGQFSKAGDLPVLRHNGVEYSVIQIGQDNSDQDWPGCRAYVRMISHKRIRQADYNPEPQYFVSSTDNPQLIAEAADNRWQIEDGLHLFKDSLNHEDKCSFTKPGAIKTMAVVNDIVYAFYELGAAIARKEMANAIDAWRNHPATLLDLVLPLLRRGREMRRFARQRALAAS